MSAFFEHVHFLRPLWLLALVLLPLLPWLWRRRQQGGDPWRRIVDPKLLPYLSQGREDVFSRTGRLWLLAIGYLLVVLALAGPAFRQAPQTVLRLQSALVVAVDLSDHMRVTDLKPDRMARVRFKLADLLARRTEGQIALIGYAGDAFTVAPLTDDAASLADLAVALSPDVMPVPGQRADLAIDLALRLLHDADQSRGELLLITDGVDVHARQAAQRAAAAGMQVSVLGVGTVRGAPIPMARGGFVQDPQGGILIPRLDGVALADLAQAGNGRYAELRVDDGDLRSLGVLDARLDPSQASAAAGEGQVAWHDEGPWLLLLVLPLAALGFRRGWLGCVLVAMLLPVQPAQAFDWAALWQRDDQRAWQALRQGDPAEARRLAHEPALAGAAAYRAGDFAAATEQFAAGTDATANYNRGNALAESGKYEEAIAAYDRALAQQPDFPDATANRKAVEDWLHQQQQQEQQGNQGQQGRPDQQSGKDQQGQQGGKDQQDKQDPSDDQGPSGQQSGQDQQGQSGQQSGQDQPGDKEQQDAGASAGDADKQDAAGDDSSSRDSPQPSGDDARDRSARPDAADANAQSKPRKDGDEDGTAQAGQTDTQTLDETQKQEASQRFGQDMQQALEQEPKDAGAPAALQDAPVDAQAEQQQAMEHLLRRVPDDPGGLLRRKFQLEYQRRQQQGDRR